MDPVETKKITCKQLLLIVFIIGLCWQFRNWNDIPQPLKKLICITHVQHFQFRHPKSKIKKCKNAKVAANFFKLFEFSRQKCFKIFEVLVNYLNFRAKIMKWFEVFFQMETERFFARFARTSSLNSKYYEKHFKSNHFIILARKFK